MSIDFQYAAEQWRALCAALGLDDAASHVGVVTELTRLREQVAEPEHNEQDTEREGTTL